MSLPARRGPWWYYSQTEEGKDYGIHCRRPARGRGRSCPRPASPARRSRSCSTRTCWPRGRTTSPSASAAVSHDHGWLAYSHRPARQREVRAALQARSTPRPPPAPESVPEDRVRPGLVCCGRPTSSTSASTRRKRPFQLWRHQLGGDPAGDALVFEEDDRRFSLGTGSTRDAAFVLIGPAQHQHHRMASHLPFFRVSPTGRAPGDPAPA